ncbi:DMSO/TMAO reductase YedYZ, molybdopterin-dependent catalytic subunit [Faunimonas pinastri]|uniref:DMSO/TMAO reductase YedYZ, molybdopterin-dependent catalytic subunit n=1 Tax=Faunimonas pinastri TaxID=1855383 RepID=A0A1H9AUF5_9HYPH|nr:molybdopterin-binding protein [Faunimonas pinastri]SEP80432.1 DMSO/TMAO reductase YedYZ, molybdopterin-dependent catalytic subunit [Faunimonas pinastri]
MADPMNRRGFLTRASLLSSSLLLSGCDPLVQQSWFRNILYGAENVTRSVQGLFLSDARLAPEYSEADISPKFRANGTIRPDDDDYTALAADDFSNWKLEVGGLVERPASYSLADLRGMPSRTQITRHDCVEGWSCIGKWKGVPLAHVLDLVGLKPQARFIVFYCADTMEQTLDGEAKYYESVAIADARHPQTILAYEMNDQVLPIPHGAPLRLRLERQLGYKMAKYIMKIEAVESLKEINGGNGGYWEDNGYEWYAGI